MAVAEYMDRLAAGADPLDALPTLGAFADHAIPGERVDSERIADNLALAALRTSEELLRPSAYADLRKRAETVLKRRPGIGSVGARSAADEVMGQLQAGSAELLKTLRFEEAREILEKRPQGLEDTVRHEMNVFRAELPPGSQAEGLPWNTYEQRARDLRRGPSQRDAAQELCDLDDAQRKSVFSRPTRTKLERLLRDKSVNGSNPSCPEAAIVRAAQQLGGLIDRVQVLSPLPPGTSPVAMTRTAAGRILTLACARLRLGTLMRAWSFAGGEVDGVLLRAADEDDLGDILEAFGDAGLGTGAQLPTLQLRLHSVDGSTVQVDWKPDLDDAAALRAAILFAEAPTLTLALQGEPTLHAFCAAIEAKPVQPVPKALLRLANSLQTVARSSLDHGLDPSALNAWTAEWTSTCVALEASGDTQNAEALALAGAVTDGNRAAALTAFAPLKAEWLAQYLEALWSLVNRAEEPGDDLEPTDAVATASGIARTTATHHPAHLRLSTQDRAILPTSEGRIWSLYGGRSARDESGFAGGALSAVVMQLLTLQPEAAGHLRCLTWGPGAADLLVREAVNLIGKRVGRAAISRIEVFCVGSEDADRPDPETLAHADDQLRNDRDVLELRYIDTLDRARELLRPSNDFPAVHLALVTGLTEGGERLLIESREVSPPADDSETLFAPRVWQRARQDRRTLLMPPAATPSGHAWLRLQNAVEDAWPEEGQLLQVPEVRTGALDIASKLQQVHDLALWVATLDRYATRDSLEQALGRDQIAILHQERRLSGDSPLSLVLSQKSGGPADRAIGRSLRAARIITEPDVALSIGTKLRQVASQGYGILALQAATSGAGINELVGHVVAFSLLATTTTPWPLPPGCRVLLISLDEYRHWFPGKRADLLAIALDTRDEGVHVATIEVKARRSDENDAAAGALDQLNQTLAATKWAAYPVANSVHSRLWLNRIAEAAYAVARESRFKLDAAELRALEAFRLGRGSLEWAGVGLVFGPKVEALERTFRADVANDIVPVVLHGIPLTEELLRTATSTSLTTLRTVETDRPPLESTRTRRRPEGGPKGRHHAVESDVEPESATGRKVSVATPYDQTVETRPLDRSPESSVPADRIPIVPADREGVVAGTVATPGREGDSLAGAAQAVGFHAPLLGWDAVTGEEIRWHPAGSGQGVLQNGHTEIWGSSGMGKTQFAMSLLGQLSKHSGSRFGIADFKNDYSDDTGFPSFADAHFLDLWNDGAPYNPLALDDETDRGIQSAVIELRDTVEEAVKSVNARLGVRQKSKLEKALTEAYSVARAERRWPTLRTLDDCLDEDLSGVIGDLTRNDLFKAGEPLGNVVDHNVVFGLSKIPGNGQTTVLAAGFIFSSLLLRVQNLPPVPNTIRYVAVIDEAHRVAPFRAIQTMIREGRSKGLAVLLATQGPLDLPDVVAANAQTKICFGLPDATVAAMAARKLQPDNRRLPEQIRTLGKGEAFVSFAGEIPRLIRMTQAYRDAHDLGLPELRQPQ
ncbi:hypothetical protein JOJ86_006227 [Rhodococcus percolatus]|uniref:type IV secretion system protein VirB4 n=1 Tax=Rhodococcus opacus TaxID=37919 RepID=UPI0017B65EEA|nr:type IV secretion system protein VirB4 [Rhodococcus opacus]MBA8964949.1 hypothetical protein [Rhodococcus opacus]MBP2208501.1 hypothetical protein [Rhodococcus opacus]